MVSVRDSRKAAKPGLGSATHAEVGSPGKRTLTGGTIHRKAVGEPGTESPAQAFAHATAGVAASVPFRGEMEHAFSHDFSSVQAHLGQPEGMASLGAAAAVRGDQVAFAAASPDKQLVAHELAHVVQARNAGGASGADSVSSPGSASEVEADRAAERVANGGTVRVTGRAEPAIQCAPATPATTPAAPASGTAASDQAAAPSSARAAVVNEVNALLTTDVTALNFAVTDADAVSAVAKLNSLSAADRTAALSQIDLFALVENCPPSDALWSLLLALTRSQFDALVNDRARLFAAVFGGASNAWGTGMDVEDAHGNDAITNVPELYNLWRVLLSLPPGTVSAETIKQINLDGRDGLGHGSFNPGTTQVNIGTGEHDAETSKTLFGGVPVNAFDQVVRHEVGHSIDAKVSGSRTLTPLANAGRWQDYGSNADAALAAMAQGANYRGTLDSLKGELGKSDGISGLRNASTDPAFQTLCDALTIATSRSPYETPGVPLGGKIYQLYGGTWSSHDADVAKLPCKVSDYQFASPKEWFAEMYSAYYQANADGSCDHSFVRDRMIRDWFNANVDPNHGAPTAAPAAAAAPATPAAPKR